MKVPYSPGCFQPAEVNPMADMAARVRQSVADIKKAKNTILLAAFARRTGLKGTEKQIKDQIHRFKRILSPETERVLLDGVPLVEFKNPTYERVDGEDLVSKIDIKFQYKDFTVL